MGCRVSNKRFSLEQRKTEHFGYSSEEEEKLVVSYYERKMNINNCS